MVADETHRSASARERLSWKNAEKQIFDVITNPCGSLDHIHFYGPRISGVNEYIELAFKAIKGGLVKDEQGHTVKDAVILKVNCLYLEGSLKKFFALLQKQLGLATRKEEFHTFAELADALNSLHAGPHGRRIYLVLLEADALQLFSHSDLKRFFRLPPEVNHFFRIVSSGELHWSNVANTGELISDPIVIPVYPPTTEEIYTLIAEALSTIPKTFIRLCVEMCSLYCIEVNKLQPKVYDAWENYKSVCEERNIPYDGGKIDLKLAKECIQQVQKQETLRRLVAEAKKLTLKTSPLPLAARYVLLASFFASQNAPASDSRYFSKHHGKEKRSHQRERHAAMLRETAGPDIRQFELTRAKMIFVSLINIYAPTDKDLLLKTDVRVQLSSLQALGLLQRTSNLSNLSQPKFKCVLDHETAKTIAATISENLQIGDHLEQNSLPKMSEAEVTLSEKAMIEKEWGLPLEELYKKAVKYYKESEGNGNLVVAYEDRLQFMAYSKQVKLGPYQDSHNDAGWFDFTGSDRIKAWQALGQLGRDEAMSGFVFLLDRVCPPFKQFVVDSIEAPKPRTDESELRVLNGHKIGQPGTHHEHPVDFQVYEAQRKQIQEALNAQTYHQFLAYAQQQIPGNPEQVDFWDALAVFACESCGLNASAVSRTG
ncbi:unnamed protein product, partial [Mesorhabditis spiculigera]